MRAAGAESIEISGRNLIPTSALTQHADLLFIPVIPAEDIKRKSCAVVLASTAHLVLGRDRRFHNEHVLDLLHLETIPSLHKTLGVPPAESGEKPWEQQLTPHQLSFGHSAEYWPFGVVRCTEYDSHWSTVPAQPIKTTDCSEPALTLRLGCGHWLTSQPSSWPFAVDVRFVFLLFVFFVFSC